MLILLKVEGRNKTAFYAGSVARAYRMAIDDYFEDKNNWDYQKYMKEIDAISNRGYTLAFHDGRLTNLAHDYDSSRSSSFYEFAGQIIDYEDDAMIVEFKNKIIKGDVLEFMVPNSSEIILLRIYEFDLIEKNKIVEEVHGGQKPKVRIKTSLFHQENSSTLKEKLPILSLIRKEKLLNNSEHSRIELHGQSHKIESGAGSEKKYQQKRNKYLSSIEAKLEEISPKTPRIGDQGCCGKGCNGCLIFWHDAKYQKARELLSHKKIGEML